MGQSDDRMRRRRVYVTIGTKGSGRKAVSRF